MSLKIKIAERLKAKAAGVNLSQKRIDAIVARAEKGLTDDSDDAAIDSNLDAINDLTPFKDIAALDDHERAKAKKLADDKEAARLKAIEDGKTADDANDDAPAWAKAFMKQQSDKAAALEAQIAAITGDKVTTTRRQQYEKALEGTDPKYSAKALKDFDRISFKDDEDFSSWIASETEVAKDFAVSEFVSDRPTGSAGKPVGTKGEASEAELDAAFNNLKI